MLSLSYRTKQFTYFPPNLKFGSLSVRNTLCRPDNENLYSIICKLLAMLCQVHVKQGILQHNGMQFLPSLIVF